MRADVYVMDAACDGARAMSLHRAYRHFAWTMGFIPNETALDATFEGDDGPWIGGALTSEQRKELAAGLAVVRQRIEAACDVPHAIPLHLHGDPYFRDLFHREPDAWLVSGGSGSPVTVHTSAARDAELARRNRPAYSC